MVQLDNVKHPRAIQAPMRMKKALGLSSQNIVPAVVQQGIGVLDTFNGLADLIVLELKRGAAE